MKKEETKKAINLRVYQADYVDLAKPAKKSNPSANLLLRNVLQITTFERAMHCLPCKNEKMVSLSLFITKPEPKVNIDQLPLSKSMKNLTLLFNGSSTIENFKILSGRTINNLTISLDEISFLTFWDEISTDSCFKTINIYLELASLERFEEIFIRDSSQFKKICQKIYFLSRAHKLTGLNFNVLFKDMKPGDIERLKELKLKVLVFNENKYYFGFLYVFSLNLAFYPNRHPFFETESEEQPKLEPVFAENQQTLEVSLKLCKLQDTPILAALKCKKLPGYVVKSVFAFLARREYTSVSTSKVVFKLKEPDRKNY